MIRIQFDGQELIEIEEPQVLVGLIQKYTRIGALYALRVVDDMDGHIILVSEAPASAPDNNSQRDL